MDRAEKALRKVEDALVAVSAAALFVMMLLMAVEVVMRYVLSSPFSWTLGFVGNYLLIAFFFLGLPYTVRVGAHISIDFLYQRLPHPLQRAATLAASVICILFVVALVYGGLSLTSGAMAGGDIPPPGSAELSWPVWTSTIMVPIGGAVVLLRLLLTALTRPPAPARSSDSLPFEEALR